MNIAIIGGGISGLTTAFYIKKLKPNFNITIFEKEKTLGGKMKSIREEGFVVEIGSNGFLSNKPDTLELVKETNSEDILIRSDDNARIRFIYKNSLERLPESPLAFLTSPLLSLKGKVRVLGELFIEAKKDDSEETLQSFGYRRVGKEMTDTFLDPMVAGIFASTPDKISVNSAFPAVVKLEKEYGGLFKGMVKKRKKEAGPGGILMSFKNGVSTFIERLANSLESDIEKGSEIIEVEKVDEKYRVKTEEREYLFDKVIFSTPAFVTADLLKNIDGEITKRLKEIEYSPISVVALGYENLSHPLKGFGLLTTSSAKKDILGVLWDSSIFKDRAERGKKLLRVMIGGQRNPEKALKSDKELIEMAIEGIEATMGVTQKPIFTYVKRYEKGIPNYKIGHRDNVEEIMKLLKNHKNLYLSSNAYYGVGLNDCVSNSKKVALEVVK